MRKARIGTLAAAVTVLLFTGVARAGISDDSTGPDLSSDVQEVLLPLVTEEELNGGELRTDPSTGFYAVHLNVTGGEAHRGWVLWVRADQSVFRPEAVGKPCTDLRWKLDQEDQQSYRRLDDHEAIVLENPAGGDARVTLDVSVDLGWRTSPGTYSLGLLFRVVYL